MAVVPATGIAVATSPRGPGGEYIHLRGPGGPGGGARGWIDAPPGAAMSGPGPGGCPPPGADISSNAVKRVFSFCFGGDRNSSISGRFPARVGPGGLGKGLGRAPARFVPTNPASEAGRERAAQTGTETYGSNFQEHRDSGFSQGFAKKDKQTSTTFRLLGDLPLHP